MLLCYVERRVAADLRHRRDGLLILALFIIVGLAAGGFGIANEKRWGYLLAVVGRGRCNVLLYVALFGSRDHQQRRVCWCRSCSTWRSSLLLVHPMSRDYQRIWFK